MAWPSLASYTLSFLAAFHGISLDHHNAASDAATAAEIILGIGREQEVDCPFLLAEMLDVTIGWLFPDGEWTPSSAPVFSASSNTLELRLPEGFDASTHPLHGKTVVFTGTLAFFTRPQAFQLVELFGGMPKDTVSRKTDVLVTGIQDMTKLAAGETESSKLRKARDLRMSGCPIEIITDREFQQLVLQVTPYDEQTKSQSKEET
jgi:DNA polymerase III subunit epsilon